MPQSIRAKRDLPKEKNYQINSFILFLGLSFFSIIFIYLASVNLLFALGFAALGAIALIFYQKPEIGIFLIVFSILGGQLLKLNIGSAESGLLASDILIPFFIFVWLLRVLIKKDKIPSSFIGPFLFVFIFIAIISMINGLRFLEQKQAVVSVFYLIRLINYALLFFASISIFSQNEGGIKRFKAVLILTFVLFAVVGIFQVIYFPSLAAWTVKYGWDPHMGRLFSTFLDPNFAGAFLVIGLIISLSLLTYAKTIENKLILTLVSALELTAIILTYSRSTYLFLFISFFVLSILRSRKLLLIGITAIIILFILFPRSLERIQGGFSVDESARNRFKSWANTVTIIRDYPILGVGYNTYRYAQENYGFIKPETTSHAAAGSDASFLTIFATTGVLGVISFILFYLISIIKTKKIYNFSESLQKRAFGLALFSILVGLAFHSIFVNSLLYPAIMIILFVFLGLISADTPT